MRSTVNRNFFAAIEWHNLLPYSLLILLPFLALFVCAQDAATQKNGDVVTRQNDNFRSGLNSAETILTPANVQWANFGLLFTLSVDGQVHAEPLYASRLLFPDKSLHDVLIVATENDSVYGFDAVSGTQLWHTSVLATGETPSDARNCDAVTPIIGITSTPVIDRSVGPHGTVYLIAMSKDSSGNYHQRLHALDLVTGVEVLGGPTEIEAKYPGTGDNSSNGYVIFDPAQYKERVGLLLLNHVVYTAWSSHCDIRPYTGWVIGYNEHTLRQANVLNITPNGNEGAIWQSNGGLAADTNDFIYLLAANGIFDTTLNAQGFPSNSNFGNAFLKISTAGSKLSVVDYFTMSNTVTESEKDIDLGAGGVMLLPNLLDSQGRTRQLAIGAGKDSNIYVANRHNLGKFNPSANNIYQEVENALPNGEWGSPAYFNGTVYYGASGEQLKAFQISNAQLSTTATSQSATSFAYPGTTPSISADGNQNGIVWACEHGIPAVLHAYDATNLATELYNSNQAPNSRDHFGDYCGKFMAPMISHGRVYVGTASSGVTGGVGVFGLLSSASSATK